SGCVARNAWTFARCTPMPRPWISRTSVKPRAWAALRYSSTTERMSSGRNEWRSSASSIGSWTGSGASASVPILDARRDHVIALRLDVAPTPLVELDDGIGAGQAGLLADLGKRVLEARLIVRAPLQVYVDARDADEVAGGRRVQDRNVAVLGARRIG